MAAGLRIVNDTGSTQIDENWKNYGFRQKISVPITAYYTSPPNPPGWGGMPYSLVVAGSPQLLVACRASVLHALKFHSYYDGTNWTLNWLFAIPGADATTEVVDFYVFDAMVGTPSNVALKVFNAAGELVFHSDSRPMKLGSIGNPGVQPCNVGFSGAGGRTYVPLIMSTPLACINLGIPVGNRLFSYPLLSYGSSIVAGPLTSFGSFAGLSNYNLPGLYAAIDVTGL